MSGQNWGQNIKETNVGSKLGSKTESTRQETDVVFKAEPKFTGNGS